MKKYASLQYNMDFFEFYTESKSGYVCAQDPKGEDIYLLSDSNYCEIGVALLRALSKSRIVEKENSDYSMFEISAITRRYKDFVEYALKTYGYKNKTAMFKNMQHCKVKFINNEITISPKKHVKLEGWEGVDPKFDLALPSTSSPEIIGAAVKYSISRCTGKGADLVAKKLFPDGVPETFDDYLALLNLKS